ncbi:hypothetical protein EDB85DRAFT_1896218 [Lactarius pseudohatsudake]|nr:hypothetical protein EDB85DRAFT_1896218 [Lactarius pseudohatsudake]
MCTPVPKASKCGSPHYDSATAVGGGRPKVVRGQRRRESKREGGATNAPTKATRWHAKVAREGHCEVRVTKDPNSTKWDPKEEGDGDGNVVVESEHGLNIKLRIIYRLSRCLYSEITVRSNSIGPMPLGGLLRLMNGVKFSHTYPFAECHLKILNHLPRPLPNGSLVPNELKEMVLPLSLQGLTDPEVHDFTGISKWPLKRLRSTYWDTMEFRANHLVGLVCSKALSKGRVVPYRWSRQPPLERNEQGRAQFQTLINRHYSPEQLVFADESHFNRPTLRRSYAWSIRGEHSRQCVPTGTDHKPATAPRHPTCPLAARLPLFVHGSNSRPSPLPPHDAQGSASAHAPHPWGAGQTAVRSLKKPGMVPGKPIQSQPYAVIGT